MNDKQKRVLLYVTLAVIAAAFIFGSTYVPLKKINFAPAQIAADQQPLNFKNGFNVFDYIIIGCYFLIILGVAFFVSRKKKGEVRTEEDYFLAGKSLPWWAIGSSLIAANISAEQFIGQSGSGFAIGLAVAAYEWMAALTLIIVGKFFLPIFIEKKIYTIPEFVEKRFDTSLKSILSIFWLALYIFVNLGSILFLGAMAIQSISGFPFIYSIILLAIFAIAYSLYGGLSAVAWTDVIQVVVLILAGIVTTVIALNNVSSGAGVIAGFKLIAQSAPEHFGMIIQRGNPEFQNIPGIASLIGGLWVANLYYWGFNQYIIQRTFAAKSLKESQRGIAFAAIIKIIIPFIVVIPGITAYVMYKNGMIEASRFMDGANVKADLAFPNLINMLPPVIKGLAFAGLIAAIISSLASMLNSTATIFTMDLYKPYIEPKIKGYKPSAVNIGRLSALVALLIALPMSLVMTKAGQVFQVIQEWTGLVSPGILAIFLLGLFWKKTTTKGATIAVILSIPIALLFKAPSLVCKIMGEGAPAWMQTISEYLPFWHQMGWTLILTMVIAAIVSLKQNKMADDPKGVQINSNLFKTDTIFNLVAYAILVILAFLYVVFWNTDMVARIFGA